MHDGKALQSGTSHNFGDGFAKAFGIQYTAKDNTLQYVHQTSWGMTTRLIGASSWFTATTADWFCRRGSRRPRMMVIPIAQHKEGVLDKAYELKSALADAGL